MHDIHNSKRVTNLDHAHVWMHDRVGMSEEVLSQTKHAAVCGCLRWISQTLAQVLCECVRYILQTKLWESVWRVTCQNIFLSVHKPNQPLGSISRSRKWKRTKLKSSISLGTHVNYKDKERRIISQWSRDQHRHASHRSCKRNVMFTCLNTTLSVRPLNCGKERVFPSTCTWPCLWYCMPASTSWAQ